MRHLRSVAHIQFYLIRSTATYVHGRYKHQLAIFLCIHALLQTTPTPVSLASAGRMQYKFQKPST